MSRVLVLVLAVASAACQAPDPRATAGSRSAQAHTPQTLAEQVHESALASQPGTQHRKLEPLAGDWNVELVDVAVDQQEHTVARGDAHLEWVHDRRYLAWTARLEGAGSTSGFLGYDLRQQQYQLLMISSLSSGMGVATGYGDVGGQGIRFTLESFDPVHNQRARMSSVLRAIEANHFVLDAYGVDGLGVERVVRRTHYRRAGAGGR